MADQSRYLDVSVEDITSTRKAILANSPQTGRRTWVHIVNLGTNVVYIGPDTVTSTNGYPVPPQNLAAGIDGEKIIENHSGAVYAICATAETATIRIMAQRD